LFAISQCLSLSLAHTQIHTLLRSHNLYLYLSLTHILAHSQLHTISLRTCVHTYTHTHTYTQTQTHTPHVHTRTHTQTHTHTQTQTRALHTHKRILFSLSRSLPSSLSLSLSLSCTHAQAFTLWCAHSLALSSPVRSLFTHIRLLSLAHTHFLTRARALFLSLSHTQHPLSRVHTQISFE